MASNEHHSSNSFTDTNVSTRASPKRRRNSTRHHRLSSTAMLLSPTTDDESFEGRGRRVRETVEDDNDEIAISSSGKTVTPFLTEHIPRTYNPMSGQSMDNMQESNTKYCNRHRPDRKCRRQANEPSMEQLQTVSHGTAMCHLSFFSFMEHPEDPETRFTRVRLMNENKRAVAWQKLLLTWSSH